MITRREVLAGLAATATAPGAVVTQAQSAQRNNLYDILDKFNFLDVDGNKVNIRALKKSLEDQHVTVSFGFTSCADICTFINPSLAAIGDIAPNNVTSIAINTWPSLEGLREDTRRAFTTSITDVGAKQPVISLFPADRWGNPSNDVAAHVQQALGQIISDRDPAAHSSFIMLFDKQGNKQGDMNVQSNTQEDFIHAWQPLIAPQGLSR